ncbi:uncharacterized protein CPUR_01550 [Claviceps purpurea 20.1]|uniref:Uncharacterized protein n=1 Tax=Claviceps purpurea (strain 20.1) TaxID=1111077 RepID=M1VZF7_CLAP2|nr:uncharacterized protein CPUR_01550 [Claviceps purpurea 20.1]
MPKKDYGESPRISERIGAQPLERSIKHEEVENAALSTSLLESSPASPKPEAPVTKISLITSAGHGANQPSHDSVASTRDRHAYDRQQNSNDNADGGARVNPPDTTTVLQALLARMDQQEQVVRRKSPSRHPVVKKEARVEETYRPLRS